MEERVVVVGAGPAGLAAAWAIRRVGVDPLIVEQAGAVAASWRARHDQLRLNTHRMFSHQPGARIPRRYGPFPARDDYVAYLEQYAAGMRLKFGTAVGRIGRAGPGWELELGDGSLSTAHVVVATGPDAEPVMPGWPGMAGYRGMLIHAGQFRDAGEVAGRDVLVVGPGNSGVDLLNHLVRSDAAWPVHDRTAVAVFLPRAATADSLPLMLPRVVPPFAAALIAAQSSLVFEYVARQKIDGPVVRATHWKQLPVPAPDMLEPHLPFIVPRVLELVYTSSDMGPFSRDLDDTGDPFAWDPDRRASLQAELDTFFFCLYGIDGREDVEYIIDTLQVSPDGLERGGGQEDDSRRAGNWPWPPTTA